MKTRRFVALLLLLGFLVVPFRAQTQAPRIHRVGVIFQGGVYAQAVRGLRDGLKELGLEEGKHVVFDVHDAKGDLAAVEAAARRLEETRVDLIVTVATSVTLAARRATKTVPIVFYAGTDPVTVGLVESFRKPGGRLTGVHGQLTDLTAKRLELLKAMLPKARRLVTFYNPANPASQQSVKFAREAVRQLKLELTERTVASVEELRTALSALRPGEADAFFYISDAMVASQEELIVATATAIRLPTMFSDNGAVARGALASYGESYYELGRRSAKHVQRILQGADPGQLPVEQLDRPRLAINLKTAKAFGLTIPAVVRDRADELIE
jgi:putative ABC transport system substrate-binding protein